MARRRRLIKNDEDHDPMAVLTNLFDVAMVFAVALMVALVTRFDMTEMFSQEDFTVVKNPGTEQMEIITKKGEKIEKYTPSEDQSGKNSRGKRVGTAYQLENGKSSTSPNREMCNGEAGPGMFPAPASLRTPPAHRPADAPEIGGKIPPGKQEGAFRIRRYPAIFAVGRAARRILPPENGFRQQTGEKQGRTDNYFVKFDACL